MAEMSGKPGGGRVEVRVGDPAGEEVVGMDSDVGGSEYGPVVPTYAPAVESVDDSDVNVPDIRDKIVALLRVTQVARGAEKKRAASDCPDVGPDVTANDIRDAMPNWILDDFNI